LNAQLVLAENKEPVRSQIVIGTTALLHREGVKPRLVIVDEQHKFSREQREQMVGHGVHLLEVSATCIPRSQALVQYGVMSVSRLNGCHVNKTIHTKVWTNNERHGLFNSIKQTVASGHKVLVIYPKRGEGDDEDGGLQSVERAAASWDRVFPNQIRVAHGGRTADENDAAIKDVSAGRACILISTTVIEVGITIPRLRHAIVVHAERFGLTTLHQLRGRLCRDGGTGHFDLYLPSPCKKDVFDRLSILEKTADGFEVAEMDMRLRGFGDLSANSDKQTGDGASFLIGRNVSVDMLEKAVTALSR
jgi:ATP-dependent DNA helicase RecG